MFTRVFLYEGVYMHVICLCRHARARVCVCVCVEKNNKTKPAQTARVCVCVWSPDNWPRRHIIAGTSLQSLLLSSKPPPARPPTRPPANPPARPFTRAQPGAKAIPTAPVLAQRPPGGAQVGLWRRGAGAVGGVDAQVPPGAPAGRGGSRRQR